MRWGEGDSWLWSSFVTKANIVVDDLTTIRHNKCNICIWFTDFLLFISLKLMSISIQPKKEEEEYPQKWLHMSSTAKGLIDNLTIVFK